MIADAQFNVTLYKKLIQLKQNAAALKVFNTALKTIRQKRKKPACAGFSVVFSCALNLAEGSARFASRHWLVPASLLTLAAEFAS